MQCSGIQEYSKLSIYKQMGKQNSKIPIKQQQRVQKNSERASKLSMNYFDPLPLPLDQILEELSQEKTSLSASKRSPRKIQKQLVQEVENDEIKVKWDSFIKMKKANYLDEYQVLKEVGKGQFGCVNKVKNKFTGIYRAAKKIKKAKLLKEDEQKFFTELQIMQSLDHPNIIKLFEVYDYNHDYVLIMELYEGGELLKKIYEKSLSERDKANIMRSCIQALIYLHSQGIVHRDLKPENILFEKKTNLLKIIDFGIATRKKPEEILTLRVGTPYYIAPEVLCKQYTEKCDIWSVGVILFLMVVEKPPFQAQTQAQLLQNILLKPFQFDHQSWDKHSSECLELAKKMLIKNPYNRPNAKQCLSHPFLKKSQRHERALKNLQTKKKKILANVKGFSFKDRLEAVVRTYIVSQLLNSSEKMMMHQVFQDIDVDNNGVITIIELKEYLQTHQQEFSKDQSSAIIDLIDINSSGSIDYTEFLVAGIDMAAIINQDLLRKAFAYFDIDHSGSINFEQIQQFLGGGTNSDQVARIFKEVDGNGDGNISQQQFVTLILARMKDQM